MNAIKELPGTVPAVTTYRLCTMGELVYWACWECERFDSDTFNSPAEAIQWARRSGWSVYGDSTPSTQATRQTICT